MVDFPNSTKAKKIFLCLFAGTPFSSVTLPHALGAEGEDTVQYNNERCFTNRGILFKGVI